MLPQENKYLGFACDLKASRMHQLLTHCFHNFQSSFLNMAVNNLRMLSVATSRPGPWGFWPEAWWLYDSFWVPVTLLRSVLYPCRSLPAGRLATLSSVKVQPRGVGRVRVDGDGTTPRSWPNSFRPKKCMLARLEPSRIFPNTSSNKQSKRSCFRVVLYYCNREIFPGSESPEISVARTRIDRCSNLPPWGSSKLLSVAPRNQWWRRARISQILQQRPRGMRQNSGSGQCWACIAWEPPKSLGWILSLWLVYRSCGPQAIWNLSFHFGWLGVYKFSARYYLLNGVLEIMWVPNLFFGPWDLVKKTKVKKWFGTPTMFQITLPGNWLLLLAICKWDQCNMYAYAICIFTYVRSRACVCKLSLSVRVCMKLLLHTHIYSVYVHSLKPKYVWPSLQAQEHDKTKPYTLEIHFDAFSKTHDDISYKVANVLSCIPVCFLLVLKTSCRWFILL